MIGSNAMHHVTRFYLQIRRPGLFAFRDNEGAAKSEEAAGYVLN